MSSIIGIFDEESDLDAAMEALHELEVDDGALIVMGGVEQRDDVAPAAGPTVLPGATPDSRNAGVAVRDDRSPPSVRATVSEQLGDLVENEEQLRHYASALAHGGRLLALRVPPADAERVVRALYASNASHVDAGRA